MALTIESHYTEQQASLRASGKAGHVEPRTGTQSIERAVAILRYIAAYDSGGARLIDVVRDLNLQRSTAHRILLCLSQERLVSIKKPDQRYILGPLTFELGLRSARREHLREVCRPSIERVANDSGDVVFLSVRSALETVCVDRAEGNYPVRAYTREIGDRRPIGFGAVGISMLSLLPDEEVRQVLSDGADNLKAYNGQTPEMGWASVVRTRKRGFALNVRESHGLRAIALPIRGATGQPIAAMSLCAIASRLGEERAEELAKKMRNEIKKIEDRLQEAALQG